MKHPGRTYGGFVPAISEQGMTMMVYKMPTTLQAGGTRSFPPSARELLELSTHPIVTFVHL
jgi:hypothetical protein